MNPDLAAAPAPTSPWASEADRERHGQALRARLDRTEREIQTVLAAIQSRAADFGPHQRADPTPLELARLEAARVRRESIEQEMQAHELDERR